MARKRRKRVEHSALSDVLDTASASAAGSKLSAAIDLSSIITRLIGAGIVALIMILYSLSSKVATIEAQLPFIVNEVREIKMIMLKTNEQNQTQPR